jgi:hypothetical protein
MIAGQRVARKRGTRGREVGGRAVDHLRGGKAEVLRPTTETTKMGK